MNLLNDNNALTSLAELIPTCMFMAQAAADAVASSEVLTVRSDKWTLSMLIPIVLGAFGYLFIQYGVVKSWAATLAGGVAFGLVAAISFAYTPGTFESAILMIFCALATGGGVGFLVAREPVYAALGFATAVLSVCGVLFMQSALFVAAATMIVYAGATIIIFLFVLMFAQQTELRNYDVQLNKPAVAVTFGSILLATIAICVTSANALPLTRIDSTRAMSAADLPENLRSEAGKLEAQKWDAIDPNLRHIPNLTAGLGRSMYTDYLIAVELAGTVLLVATIGAIALAQRTTETQT